MTTRISPWRYHDHPRTVFSVSDSALDVICNIVSRPAYLTAECAIIVEEVSLSPAGFPAGCQVMSTNSGQPSPIRSNLARRLIAPLFVRGGKNSREKNLSPDSILLFTFSRSVMSVDTNLRKSGDCGRVDIGVSDVGE